MIYLAVFLGLIPSFAWLLFYLREDTRHPEPKRMIAFAFLLGGLATFLAYYFSLWASGLLSSYSLSRFGVVSLLSLSAIEEILKFALIFWFIRRSRYFDEPVDSMVYMVTAALGFAAVENIAVSLNQWNDFLTLNSVFEAVTLRFIGATLLHSLSSGLVGYYWARGWLRRRPLVFITFGLILATLAHALFNYLILNFGSVIIPTMFLVVVGLLVLNDFEKLKIYP